MLLLQRYQVSFFILKTKIMFTFKNSLRKSFKKNQLNNGFKLNIKVFLKLKL